MMVPGISRLTFRDLTADDLDAAFEVRSRSFGLLTPSLRDWWNEVQRGSYDEDRAIGAFDRERVVAHWESLVTVPKV